MKSVMKKFLTPSFLQGPLRLGKFFYRALVRKDDDVDDNFNHPYAIL